MFGLLAQVNYGNWLPPQLARHGGDVDRLIDTVHVFMFLIFVPWALFFAYCLLKYRSRGGHSATYTPIKAKLSKYAEVAVAAFEVVLLVGFSYPVWADYKNAPPAPDKRIEVRVIAEQFQWDFHYPGPDGKFGQTKASLISASNPIGLDDADAAAADDIVRVNEFYIPTGRDIYLRLTSKDVIHSFDIPTMRMKQDVIPGMEIPIWFKVNDGVTSDKLREQMTRRVPIAGANWYKLRHLVASEDHKSKSGEVVLAKGADLGLTHQTGTENIEKLAKAGVTELALQPREPLEVVCAQLCGNSHFKMKAVIKAQTPEEFDAWVAEASKKVEFSPDF